MALGEGIWCYVTLNEGEAYDDALKAELKKQARGGALERRSQAKR